MSTTYKKAILYLFCNIPTLLKTQLDKLVTFHSISYLTVVLAKHSKCVFLSGKQLQKIGGSVIAVKSDFTKIMSPNCADLCNI